MFGLFFTFLTSVLCSFAALSSPPLDNAANEQVQKPIQDMGYYNNGSYVELEMFRNDFYNRDFILTFINNVAGAPGSTNYNVGLQNHDNSVVTATFNTYANGKSPKFYTIGDDGLLDDTYSSGSAYSIYHISLTHQSVSYVYNDLFATNVWSYVYYLDLISQTSATYRLTYNIVSFSGIDNYDDVTEFTSLRYGNYQVTTIGSTLPSTIGPGITKIVYYENVDYGYTTPLITYFLRPYLNSFAVDAEGNYQSGYEAGYNVGKQESNDREYSRGYEVGKGVGDAEGYQRGYVDGQQIDETASAIFVGIVNIALVPINFFLKVLNFEVFGINIGAFASAFLTIAIIVIIIRMILGGKSNDK